MTTARLVALSFVLFSTKLYAGTSAEAWVQHYGGATSAIDRLTGLAVDANGNVLVTGVTDLADVIYRDIATVKYAGNGTALWTNRYRPTGDTYTYPDSCGIAVNRTTGVSYVAGHSYRTSGTYDFFLLAYSSGGASLWTNFYRSPHEDLAKGVTVDESSGNVYMAGTATDIYNDEDFVTVAWSSAGVALWTNRYGQSTSDRVVALAVDPASGRVYVSGTTVGATAGDYRDFVTVAYSDSGDALWTNRFNGGSNSTDVVQGIAVDSGSGNVIVVGGAGPGSSVSAHYVTLAYSSAGWPLWTNRLTNPQQSADPNAVAVEGQSGNVYVTGSSYEGLSYANDFCTVAYSRAGTPLWTNSYDDPIYNRSDVGKSVVVDRTTGQVYVTGFVYNDTGLPAGATVAYSATGTALWTNRFTVGATGEEPMALGVDAATGRVFVGSRTSDYVTLAYTAIGAPVWTNFYRGLREIGETAQALALNRSNQNLYVTGDVRNSSNERDDIVTVAYRGDGVARWTNRFNGPLNQTDQANALAVDEATGRIYVAGAATFSADYTDFTVLIYSEGGVLLRTNRYSGPGIGNNEANAVVVDQTRGRVYVTGFSKGLGLAKSDFTTIAYSNSGTQLWVNRYDPGVNGDDVAVDLAVDQKSGNVYVTGTSAVTGNSSNLRMTTIAYSLDGTQLWTNSYRGPYSGTSDGAPAAIAVNRSNGNVYVAGYANISLSSYDIVTLAYSSNGIPLWTNLFNYDATPFYNGRDLARALSVDENNGNVYVVGQFDLASIGLRSMGVLAYSSTGSLLWSNSYGAAGTVGQALAAAVDAGGNVYVTGYSSTNNLDYVTLVYSSTGVVLATNCYSGAAGKNDQPTTRFCLAVTSAGAAFVTGYSVTPTEETDFTTIKYVFGPEITVQPVSRTNDVGTAASFNVTATGMQPLSYFWRRDTVPLTDGGKVTGATTTNLTLSNLWFSDAGEYSVLVSNDVGLTLSLPASLVIRGTQPRFTDITFLPDGTVQLNIDSATNALLSLETSTNLLHWQYLTNFINSGIFRVNGSINEPSRFYRAIWLP